MKNWILALAILGTSPSLALAADPVDPAPKEAPAPKRKVMAVDGARGVWFPDATVDLIIRDKELLKEHEKALVQADALVTAQEDVTAACAAALGFSEKIAEVSQKNLLTAIRHAREAREDRDSVWSGQPAVWVGAGILASLVIATVANKLQD